MTEAEHPPSYNPRAIDRARGALFGSALGDAIGIYTEFMTASQALEIYGPSPVISLVEGPNETKFYPDSHRSQYESRAWTDDTDHAILMMLSYLRLRTLSQDDFAARLHSWVEQGLRVLDRLPMGLGQTVGGVVFSSTFLSAPAQTAFDHWEKSGRQVAANGSLMRTAPVGITTLTQSEEATFAAAISMGEVTHADPRCALSVAIVSALIRALCLGQISEDSDIQALINRAHDYLVRTAPERAALLDMEEFRRHAYAADLDSLVLEQSMGFIYKCLGSALWCLRRVLNGQDTFESVMIKLIMYGGDADTNGAVAGALVGALVGFDALPPHWRDGMRHREWFGAKVDALLVVAGVKEGKYDSDSDTDTLMDGGKGLLTEAQVKQRDVDIKAKMRLADELLQNKKGNL